MTAPANDNVVHAPRNAVPLKDRLSWSPEEAAAMTGIGLTRLRESARIGTLVARKHGSRTIILRSDLMAWLEALPLADKNTTNGQNV